MVDKGLWEPYEPTTWDQIPDGLKDPTATGSPPTTASWRSRTNTTIVPNAPKTFADLKKPEYKGMVAPQRRPA